MGAGATSVLAVAPAWKEPWWAWSNSNSNSDSDSNSRGKMEKGRS